MKPDPAEFEKVGDTLVDIRNKNPKWTSRLSAIRTAVSRYYFAAFHIALEYAVLNRQYAKLGNADDHAGVHNKLLFVKDAAADALDALRKSRNICDYGDATPEYLENLLAKAKSDLAVVKSELQ